MNQSDQVVQAVEELGGIAFLSDIYDKVDVSQWGASSPKATIRRIVQQETKKRNGRLAKLKPGLYCLREKLSEFKEQYDERSEDPQTLRLNHAFFQSILVSMADDKHEVYVPPHDRNKEYLPGKTLADLPLLPKLPSFGYESLMRHAQTVDVVWMNRRKMPAVWYEVEMTTDMRRSMQKFHELQDFYATMHIVAPESRRAAFDEKRQEDAFFDVHKRIRFRSTESLIKAYASSMASQRDGAAGG